MKMLNQTVSAINLGFSCPDYWPVSLNLLAQSSPSVCITGSSGTGKTNSAKHQLNQWLSQGVDCLVLDCQGDVSCGNLPSVSLSDGPNGEASIRPLGFSDAAREKYGDDGIADVVVQGIEASGRALGESQEAVIRRAIKIALSNGATGLFDVKKILYQIKEECELKKEKAVTETAISRLERISERNVFSHEVGLSPDYIARESMRIDLSGLSRVTQGSVMNMILSLVFHEILAEGESGKGCPKDAGRIRKIIFVDEAKISLDACKKRPGSENPMEEIIRKGRKFGVGLIFCSQNISDFSTFMTNSVGCFLAMNSFDAKERRRVVDRLGGPLEMADGWPQGVALARLSSGGFGFLRVPQAS